MKFKITTHPIEPKLLKKLGIYDSGLLNESRKFTGIVSKLAKAGFTKIAWSDIRDNMYVVHITKQIDENGKYID